MTDRYRRLADHADQGIGAEEFGLRRFTRPADYLAEIDAITDECRHIPGAETVAARLERLADHYEARHGLTEISAAPVHPATNACTEADQTHTNKEKIQ